jgi:hypothetical protein
MKRFYILKGNIARGPFTLEKLQEQQINPDDRIWCQGFHQSRRAIDVAELKALFTDNRTLSNQVNTYVDHRDGKYNALWICTLVGAAGLLVYYLYLLLILLTG